MVAGSTGGVALAQEQDARATARPGPDRPAAVTPVLSVRRLPSVVAEPIADRRLQIDLAAWAATIPGGGCVAVRDLDGDTLLDVRATEPVVPASTLKLLTATAALEAFGPDHRFRTVALGPGPEGGVLRGDLHLVGGGDPILASADYATRDPRRPPVFTDLDRLAAAIAGAGVQRIEGSVVGDESRYDRERYVAGWPARYIDQDVVGPLSALSVNDGFAEYPTREQWRELVPAPDPALEAAAVLTRLLSAHGVAVSGPARSGAAPGGLPEVAAVESPPLTDVVLQLLRASDNGTAELLTKELGHAVGVPSTAGGRARTVELLAEDGLDLTGVTLADGSGLSLDNRVTCRALLEVLADAETGPLLRAALPTAGETGTLTDVFVDTPLEGHLSAKTGTLNSVAALAGVVHDDDGELPFAYVLNAPDGRVDEAAAVASQAALGQILLDWPRLPEIERLRPLDPTP